MDIPSYLLGRIKGSGGAGVSYIVVEELPTTGEEGKIYLVPKSTSKTNNYYDEYMYINSEWEIIGDTEIDLSNYQELMQYAVVPNATSSIVGKIIQYTGATTESYTNGYFYQCVSDGNNPATYSWTNINVDNLNSKQDTLISGTNIKTINNTSLLGSGNINISGDVSVVFINYSDTQTIKNEKYQKVIDNYKNGLETIIYYQRLANSIPVMLIKTTTSESTSGTGTLTYEAMQYSNSMINSYGITYYDIANFKLFINMTDYTLKNGSVSIPSFGQMIKEYGKILSMDNSTSWTPTGDYNPATKKYVDDQVGSINTILATLTTPSNGGV